MPDTPGVKDALRRLAVATAAYAVAMAIVTSCLLPTLLSTDPVARLVPKAVAVAAWLPQAAPHILSRAAP